LRDVGHGQGDQIGRIFAGWAVICFGHFFKEDARGWGANPGPHNFIYFLIFITLPLSHSGSPTLGIFLKITEVAQILGYFSPR
jgi:hypothetical protein